jgi:hypothetical protein
LPRACAAFDAQALGRAGLRLRGRQAAALRCRHACSACGVADALLRMFVGEFHAVVLRVTAYGCALAAMGLIAAEVMTRGSLVAEAADTEWVEVNRPFPAFALALPEFDEQRYAIWRHASGGGRKDVITFGDLGSSGATAMIELYRGGGEPAVSDTDITASIGQLRLSTRPALPNTIDTKFGEVRGRAVHRQRTFRRAAMPQVLAQLRRAALRNRGLVLQRRRRAGRPPHHRVRHRPPFARRRGSEPKLGALFARAELKRTSAARTMCSSPPRASATTGSTPSAIRACAAGNKPVDTHYCLLNGFCQPRLVVGARGG